MTTTRHVRRRQLPMFPGESANVFAHAAEAFGVTSRDPAREALAGRLCDAFNARHPVGSAVTYQPKNTTACYAEAVARAARVDATGHAVVELAGAGTVPIGEVHPQDPNRLEPKTRS